MKTMGMLFSALISSSAFADLSDTADILNIQEDYRIVNRRSCSQQSVDREMQVGEEHQERLPNGYVVTYTYRGRQDTFRTQQYPRGSKIRLKITPMTGYNEYPIQ